MGEKSYGIPGFLAAAVTLAFGWFNIVQDNVVWHMLAAFVVAVCWVWRSEQRMNMLGWSIMTLAAILAAVVYAYHGSNIIFSVCFVIMAGALGPLLAPAVPWLMQFKKGP